MKFKSLLILSAIGLALIAIMPHRIFTGFITGILLTVLLILIIKAKL